MMNVHAFYETNKLS